MIRALSIPLEYRIAFGLSPWTWQCHPDLLPLVIGVISPIGKIQPKMEVSR